MIRPSSPLKLPTAPRLISAYACLSIYDLNPPIQESDPDLPSIKKFQTGKNEKANSPQKTKTLNITQSLTRSTIPTKEASQYSPPITQITIRQVRPDGLLNKIYFQTFLAIPIAPPNYIKYKIIVTKNVFFLNISAPRRRRLIGC